MENIQLDVSSNRTKLPVPGSHCMQLSCYPKGHLQTSGLLLRQLVALYNLTARPHCWRQHLYDSLSTEKSSWFSYTAFALHSVTAGKGRHSVTKGEANTDPGGNALIYTGVRPARYTSAAVAPAEVINHCVIRLKAH